MMASEVHYAYRQQDHPLVERGCLEPLISMQQVHQEDQQIVAWQVRREPFQEEVEEEEAD